jgi:hypothetical protein
MEPDVVSVRLDELDARRLEYVPTVLAFANEHLGCRRR